MRDANFKYCPIPDVQQQNDTDQNRKISNQPAEPAPDHGSDLRACRDTIAALQGRGQNDNSIWTVSGASIALYGIFSIIGERSYLVWLFSSLSLGSSM